MRLSEKPGRNRRAFSLGARQLCASRAEVRAEVMEQSKALGSASSEWAMQQNEPARPNSAYTRKAAQDEYIASRNEVNALNAEDSGSSYFATLPRTADTGVIMAGPAR
jgi:hypothetical protein